jgi:SAM-dependent methyltransferase
MKEKEAPLQAIFERAYRQKIWGDTESVSGLGSGIARTAAFRDQIPLLLSELGVKSLLDAGCGDFNWMKEVELNTHEYIGIDIVPELIVQNRGRYGDHTRTFIHGDITCDELPRVDVILCRDCLVHFSFEDAWAALRNFKRSQSTYLLTTTFVNLPSNLDIETGEWRPTNLRLPPFQFPVPETLIDEKCLHTGGIYADKRLALWRLDATPA